MFVQSFWSVKHLATNLDFSNTAAFSLPGATNSALTIGNLDFGRLTSSSATGRRLQFGLKNSF
jgi:hypothetical protein